MISRIINIISKTYIKVRVRCTFLRSYAYPPRPRPCASTQLKLFSFLQAKAVLSTARWVSTTRVVGVWRVFFSKYSPALCESCEPSDSKYWALDWHGVFFLDRNGCIVPGDMSL